MHELSLLDLIIPDVIDISFEIEIIISPQKPLESLIPILLFFHDLLTLNLLEFVPFVIIRYLIDYFIVFNVLIFFWRYF